MPLTITQGLRGRVATVEGDLVAADVASLSQAGIEIVRLSMPTWTGRGLDLLRDAAGAVRVHILAYSPLDLSVLTHFEHLQELSLFGVPAGTLDVARLPALTGLRVHLQSGAKFKLKNLESAARLEEVDGNLGAAQVEALGELTALRRVFLGKAKVESLDFLQRAHSLEAVSLERYSDLRDISVLAGLPKLEFVRFLGSRRIVDHACLAPLDGLTTLALDDSGDIESLAFVQGMARLASISFSGDTCIKDGRVNFLHELDGLGYVNFVDRPHYDGIHADFPFDRSVAEERFNHYRPLVAGVL